MRARISAAALLSLLTAVCRGSGSGGAEAGETQGETASGSDSGSESNSADESTTEWMCDESFCDDLPQPPTCGNGKVEGLEQCDGAVPHASCEDCVVVCDEGFWDCNENIGDGCEIDLAGDPESCGLCEHDCLGAACEDGRCQPVILVEGEPAPTNVAVDETHVYWTNFADPGSVARAKLDGTGRTTLTAAQSPFDLAVDADAVFFSAKDAILRVEKGGGMPTPLANATGDAQGIALDQDSVFYVDESGGTVASVEKAGGGDLALAPTQPAPRFVAEQVGQLYWTDDSAQTIARVATDGLGMSEVLSIDQAGAWDVFATADIVVWTQLLDVGEIKWIDLADVQDERTLAFSARPWGVVADADFVYWTCEGDGTVQRSASDGMQELAEIVADGQMQARGMAIDGDFVYWADTAAGTIVKLTK